MIVKNYEKKENNTAVIAVEADAAEFEAAVNSAYIKSKKNITVPGFRKGKAPRAVIEGMYGKEVFYQDAMDELAQPAFDYAVNETGVKFVGRPAIADINVTETKSCEFTYSVTLYPEVTLGQYKGVEVEEKSVVVTDEDVDAQIELTRKKNARMISIDDRAAQMGDTANIDFEGFLEGVPFEGGKGEGHKLELGSGSFVPGFEDQVVGMQIGEEKDIDITFPEDYAADLAGKAVVFKVKLNELTVPEYPELDDEFAKDVSEFDTLDEYKASVKADLEKSKTEQAENEKRADAVAAAVNNMTVEVPDVMVAEKVEETLRNYAANFGMDARNYTFEQLTAMMGLDETTINTTLRPSALMQVKTDLLLEAVAKEENLVPTAEETEAFVARMSESIGASAEEIKQYFGEQFINAELVKEQAQNLIVDNAVAVSAAE